MSTGAHMCTVIERGGREGRVILIHRLEFEAQTIAAGFFEQVDAESRAGLWSHTPSLSPPSWQRSLVVQVPAAPIPSREPD